ncbi:MAG: hypothetical protein NZ990_01535, partial [Myxococcota bacterium]|nr:hypothetical protein [Myxococcota bacterium]
MTDPMLRHTSQNRMIRAAVALLLALSFSFVTLGVAESAEKKAKRSRKNFVPSQQVGKKLIKIQ